MTAASAREVLALMIEEGRDPESLVRERGLEALSDSGELESVAQEVIAAHPEQVEQYRAGDPKLLNFLIGQVMRRTQGKANPALARELMQRLLQS